MPDSKVKGTPKKFPLLIAVETTHHFSGSTQQCAGLGP